MKKTIFGILAVALCIFLLHHQSTGSAFVRKHLPEATAPTGGSGSSTPASGSSTPAAKTLTVTGQLVSLVGNPIVNASLTLSLAPPTGAPLTANGATDSNGNFTFTVSNVQSTVTYNSSLSASQLIQGYFYQNPITHNVLVNASGPLFCIETPISLRSGGYGGFLVNGVLQDKTSKSAIKGAQLQLSIVNAKQTMQAMAISGLDGSYQFEIYGLIGASFTGQITMLNVLPSYSGNGNLGTVKLPNGTNTIVQADPILLGPATSCQIPGCKTCSAGFSGCALCNFGYTLNQTSSICELSGQFSGSGTITIPVTQFSGGKAVVLSGAVMGLRNGTLTPLPTATVCFFTTDDDSTCAGTGGTDANGIYYVQVLAQDRGGFYHGHLEFTATNYSSLTISTKVQSNQQTQSQGTITLMYVEPSGSAGK